MEPFGWAVIGSGYIVKHVLNDLSKNHRHRVISITSRNQETAEKLARKYDAEVIADAQQAITAPGVQCVYIATPHPCHFSYLMECLELGVPVLCEKPLVMNSDELCQVLAKAKENSTYFSEIMSYKFSFIYQQARALVLDGTLGALKSIEADIGFDAFARTKRKRLLSPVDGGGALLDIGVYLLSLAEDFLGLPDHLTNKAVFHGEHVDIVDDMHLTYPNATCHLECRFDHITRTQAELVFEHGSLLIPRFFQPRNISVTYGGETISLSGQFSHQAQFDDTADDILNHRLSSKIHTVPAIVNTMRLLDSAAGAGRSAGISVSVSNREK